MVKKIVKKATKKVKRKFPIEILAPENFQKKVIGKSEVTDLSHMKNKKVKLNLMYLTDKIRNQNVILTFNIDDIDSSKAYTSISKYEQVSYFLSRSLRKGSDLVEDSFLLSLKDDKKVRIKPFIVTKSYVSLLLKKSIRKNVKMFLEEYIKDITIEDLFRDILSDKVQLSLKNEIRKIYPLKNLEFKKVEVQK